MRKLACKAVKGFTLIELMITLSISGILMSLAVPSMQSFIMSSLADAQQRQLNGLITKARSMAVNYNTYTTFCFTLDKVSCNSKASSQLILFIDHNKNERLDGEDTMIRYWKPNKRFQIVPHLSLNKKYIQFRPTGQANGTAGSFQVCPIRANSIYRRAIIISVVGRPRFSRDLNKDGIHDLAKHSKIPFCS